jgi:hypothetical protein
MDYKEWVAMLRHLAIFPKQVSKQKSLEIFKQANRGAAGGIVLWKIISIFIFFGCSDMLENVLQTEIMGSWTGMNSTLPSGNLLSIFECIPWMSGPCQSLDSSLLRMTLCL